jgi:hypothetical protein
MRFGYAFPLLLLSLLCFTTPARAETVLFACSEQCPISLFEALELELRGHGAFLVARLSPSGFSVAAHESDARRMASLTPAAAVLWIERDPPLRVRVLSPREAVVREAPLATPPETIDARLFAAIAGDVVLRALGAAGHIEPRVSAGPTIAPVQQAPSPVAPSASAQKKDRSRRFFLRAAGLLGFAMIGPGMKADRPPPASAVQAALGAQMQTASAEAGREALWNEGYHCDWRANPGLQGAMIADNCTVAVSKRGYDLSPGFELQAGVYLSQRFALASFLRITPTAGVGKLNHALFGVQAEYALIAPAERGFWTNAGAGFGFGRIQVKPPGKRAGAPYVTSGPFTAHLTLPFGYRLLPSFGLYAAVSVRVLFPDVLWVVDPTLGMEGRL